MFLYNVLTFFYVQKFELCSLILRHEHEAVHYSEGWSKWYGTKSLEIGYTIWMRIIRPGNELQLNMLKEFDLAINWHFHTDFTSAGSKLFIFVNWTQVVMGSHERH